MQIIFTLTSKSINYETRKTTSFAISSNLHLCMQ